SSNTVGYQDSGLHASLTYYYRVAAFNLSGTSAYSNVANAQTLAAQDFTWLGGNGSWALAVGGWDIGLWDDSNNAIIGKGNDTAGTISVSSFIRPNNITFNAPLSGTYTVAGGF